MVDYPAQSTKHNAPIAYHLLHEGKLSPHHPFSEGKAYLGVVVGEEVLRLPPCRCYLFLLASGTAGWPLVGLNLVRWPNSIYDWVVVSFEEAILLNPPCQGRLIPEQGVSVPVKVAT